MNYEEETNKLNTGANVFKPEAGKYQIVILGEPEETEYVNEESGERTPQIRMGIEVNGEQKNWYVSRGKTYNSVFGQLMLIGKSKGKLNGEKITLLVKRSNKKNEYTIVEALNLMPNEKNEEKVA